jgi:murein DD-endopeptidase MepM/ murein hydrolase activator NlpD
MTADWVAETQLDALALLADAIGDRTDELASLLRQLGYSPAGDGGVGGPFVPAFGAAEIDLVNGELAELEQLQAFARGLPLARPLSQLQVTSGFGQRLDPFLGESAVHTGVDFRAPSGTSVMATGPGVVTEADVNGGYGKMVEIDHGNGVTTRYAHLSSILVDIGDVVTTGTIVGRAGSTGRSTGPHLHYEIRRNDTPFDPMPHLRTGPRIVGLL